MTPEQQAEAERLFAEDIDLGCDCNCSVVILFGDATLPTDSDVRHEDSCRLFDLAARLN